MTRRDLLRKKDVKTKSVTYQRAYKEAQNHVNKGIQKAKKDYYHNNNNIRQFEVYVEAS